MSAALRTPRRSVATLLRSAVLRASLRCSNASAGGAELLVGDVVEVRRAFSAAEVESFVRLSGDRNPIHTDPVRLSAAIPLPAAHVAAQAAAHAAGQSACLTPGLLVASLFPALVGSRLVRRSRAQASPPHTLCSPERCI